MYIYTHAHTHSFIHTYIHTESMVKTDEVQPLSTITGTGTAKGGFIPVYHVQVGGNLQKIMDETFHKSVVASYGSGAEGHDEFHHSEIERAYGLLVLNMDKNRIAPAHVDTSKEPDKAYAYAYRCVCVCVCVYNTCACACGY